jgi:hypothetical protein
MMKSTNNIASKQDQATDTPWMFEVARLEDEFGFKYSSPVGCGHADLLLGNPSSILPSLSYSKKLAKFHTTYTPCWSETL